MKGAIDEPDPPEEEPVAGDPAIGLRLLAGLIAMAWREGVPAADLPRTTPRRVCAKDAIICAVKKAA